MGRGEQGLGCGSASPTHGKQKAHPSPVDQKQETQGLLGAQLERGGVSSVGGHETNHTQQPWLVRLSGLGVILHTGKAAGSNPGQSKGHPVPEWRAGPPLSPSLWNQQKAKRKI